MSQTFAHDIASIAKIDAVQKILEVICHTTGLGFSAVARVTEDRWIAMAVRDQIAFGLDVGGELEIETTICNEIRQSGRLVAFDHASEDERFCDHHTPKRYGIQSYISVPITLANGRFFGTLCAIDPKPAKVNTPDIINMFKFFADLIALHLDSQDRLAASDLALKQQHDLSRLRDQFVAVLGHDLRNPLGAISSSVTLLQMTPRNDDDKEVLQIIERSVGRMSELIGNLLDFARGRLGDGISINRVRDAGLESELMQVITELKTTWPTRTINHEIEINDLVYCDPARICQMLSNLLANAITHGDPNLPVLITARTRGKIFELSVTNHGQTIPTHLLEKIFQPFVRGELHSTKQGLGLGLFISSEIAKSHHGSLTVTSTHQKTTFKFQMPLPTI